MIVSRRKLITNGLAASAVGASCIGIDSIVPQSFAFAPPTNDAARASDRILVVIQLSGGNDGLNTLVPVKDDRYYAARPELAIAKHSTLSVGHELHLHPSLRPLETLFENGLMSVVQNTGYENPNRSHFESMDIWHTCRRKTSRRQSGWLGRLLTSRAESGGDVPGLHIGGEQQPLALKSRTLALPSVTSLEDFSLKSRQADQLGELLKSPATQSNSELLDFIQDNTSTAMVASERVADAAGSTNKHEYPDNALSKKLQSVARLIESGLTTSVYYLSLDGFDTHAKQPAAHSALLNSWASSLASFVKDLELQGNAQRVCVMTFSEFGRRVKENASSGTDHGAAAPMFLTGHGLSAPVHGGPPNLEDLVDGDLKHEFDFRQVYAGIIRDWLGAEPKSVVGSFEPLQLFT
ncbi:MAG TPA: hypothetical protein DDW52_29635 [Planctomycetaceae bacterium]|nr:hypothetical protein [Planctomycetaceae bacterium]